MDLGIAGHVRRQVLGRKAATEKLDPKELSVNYNLLQVWDILSLYVCSSEVLKPDRIEPVPIAYSAGTGAALALTPLEPGAIALNPFDQPSLTAKLIFRRLTQTKFSDSAELQSVYFRTAPQIASFRLVPAAAH